MQLKNAAEHLKMYVLISPLVLFILM